LVAAAKFLVAASKKLFVVPSFVAVTEPFFSVSLMSRARHREPSASGREASGIRLSDSAARQRASDRADSVHLVVLIIKWLVLFARLC